MGDLAGSIKDIMNVNISISSDEKRLRPQKSEVDRLVADNSLARDLLDWKPEISLENGLARTVQWFNDNREQYKSDSYTI